MLGFVPSDYGPASGPKLEILDKQTVIEGPQSGKAEELGNLKKVPGALRERLEIAQPAASFRDNLNLNVK